MATAQDSSREGGRAIVTGSASGIGAACASLFVQKGWVVLGVDRADQSSELPYTLQGDLRDESTISQVLAAVGEWPCIDAVVNCAAVVNESEPWSLSTEEWLDVYHVNVVASYNLVRALLPLLERSEGPSIVNIASIAGQRSGAFSSPCYAASKAAMIALSRSMARLLADRHIRVNCVNPGITDTEMIGHWSEERMRDATAPIPLHRAAMPSEVAEAIYFLASGSASYITGAQLDVNGGLHMA